jgi:hypothetical protein
MSVIHVTGTEISTPTATSRSRKVWEQEQWNLKSHYEFSLFIKHRFQQKDQEQDQEFKPNGIIEIKKSISNDIIGNEIKINLKPK